MNAEGAACVFAKDVNLYAAANLLDMLLNARADPIIPCEFGPCVQAALALSAGAATLTCAAPLPLPILSSSQSAIASSASAASWLPSRPATARCSR